MTDTITDPDFLDTIPYRTPGGYGEMLCERVSEHVAVIPSITKDMKLLGRFTVAVSSGRAICAAAACITCTRQSAYNIAAIDADWSDPEVAAKLTPEQHEAVRHAMIPVLNCDCYGTCDVPHCLEDSHF
jgi:hypothetical protein